MKKFIFAIVLIGALLLTGCGSIEQPTLPSLPSFEVLDVIFDELMTQVFMQDESTVAEPPVSNVKRYFEEATVSRIIDGDTIVVIMPDGETERVRLIGIDAPEMGQFGSEEGAEPGAVESRDFVAELIPPGTTIWLESVGNDRDRFDRLRRYIWIELPTDMDAQRYSLTVNRLLLKYGHAVVWER